MPSSTVNNSADEQSSFFFLIAVVTAHSKSVFDTKSGRRITELFVRELNPFYRKKKAIQRVL